MTPLSHSMIINFTKPQENLEAVINYPSTEAKHVQQFSPDNNCISNN